MLPFNVSSWGCILSQIIQEAICGIQQLQKEEAVLEGRGEGSGGKHNGIEDRKFRIELSLSMGSCACAKEEEVAEQSSAFRPVSTRAILLKGALHRCLGVYFGDERNVLSGVCS